MFYPKLSFDGSKVNNGKCLDNLVYYCYFTPTFNGKVFGIHLNTKVS
jgi:hypothetical protein